MPVTKKLDQYFEWTEKYKPVKNELGTHGSYDNTMFETYGVELDHVLKVNEETPEKIWTLVEGDEGQYFIAGYHLVNRFGYFITENSWVTGTEEYSNDDEVNTAFEINGDIYICEPAFDAETNAEFIDVYIMADMGIDTPTQPRFIGEWHERSELPNPDDDDEIEEFKNDLRTFIQTQN